MIRSNECQHCGWDMVFPDKWIGKNIQCPRCTKVVLITAEMFGQKSERKAYPRLWRCARVAIAVMSVSGILLGFMNRTESPSKKPIKDAVVKMRCTSCDTPDHRLQSEWEIEAFDKVDLSATQNSDVFSAEEIPIHCNRCNEEALYIDSKTAPCAQCGHFAPNFRATFFSKFHRHDGCRHCKDGNILGKQMISRR